MQEYQPEGLEVILFQILGNKQSNVFHKDLGEKWNEKEGKFN